MVVRASRFDPSASRVSTPNNCNAILCRQLNLPMLSHALFAICRVCFAAYYLIIIVKV